MDAWSARRLLSLQALSGQTRVETRCAGRRAFSSKATAPSGSSISGSDRLIVPGRAARWSCRRRHHSPQLLWLPVSAPRMLGPHEIPIRVALPVVGRKLQITSVTSAYAPKITGPVARQDAAPTLRVELRGLFARRGIAADWPGGIMAFLRRALLACPTSTCSLPSAPMQRPRLFFSLCAGYATVSAGRAVLTVGRRAAAISSSLVSDPRVPFQSARIFFLAQRGLATLPPWSAVREIGRQSSLPHCRRGRSPLGPAPSSAPISMLIPRNPITVPTRSAPARWDGRLSDCGCRSRAQCAGRRGARVVDAR